MTRPCTTCQHPKRREIDRLLATGTPAAEVAQRFHLVDRSVRRHAENHVPAAVQAAAKQDDQAREIDVLSEVKLLHKITMAILAKNHQDGRLALGAIREARGNLELLGKLLGDLDDRPQVNVLIAPQWITVRGALLKALTPYPEARAAVAAALLEVEHVVTGE